MTHVPLAQADLSWHVDPSGSRAPQVNDEEFGPTHAPLEQYRS
jgi:hypothetical protein